MTFNLSESEWKTYQALYNYQGARIKFGCDGVTYTGIIDAILPERRQVIFRHATIANKYFGKLWFRFKEISSFKVIESSDSVNRYPKNDYLINIIKKSRPVDRATASKILYSDLTDELHDDVTDEEKRLPLILPEHLKEKLPKKYTLIDTIDEDFHEAMRSIFNQRVIGVAFHGSHISRFGKLNFICVSTNVYLFVFDVNKMGKEAFDKGLKQVLESKSVKKVIHDCRCAGDCLAHQYSTLLCHVFDTRVADFVINRQQYAGKDEFHSWPTLDCLLRWFLKVPQELLFERETTQFSPEAEIKRPITNAYLFDLLKSVLYLIILQEELLKRLFLPMYRATGFYRTILAESSDTLINDLGHDLSRPDNIIPSLLMNGIQTAFFRKPHKENLSLRCTFIHPQTGKIIYPKPEVTSNLTTPKISSLSEERKNFFDKKSMNECHKVSDEKDSALNNVIKPSNNQDENSTEEGETDNLFPKLSFRQIDLNYHKLVSEMNQSENFMNLESSANNHNSGFSNNKYFAACSNSSDMSVKNTGKESSKSGCKPSKVSDECSDIWLRLRSEVIKEKAEYPQYWNDRKIMFLPG